MELRPYQVEAKQAVLHEWDEGNTKTLLVLPTGCHAKGEKLLLANGHSKKVEDITTEDKLLGSDGKARNILFLHRGESDLYKVTPIKGEPFIVTPDHRLTLIRTRQSNNPQYPCERRAGEIVDVSVAEWMRWSKNKKHLHKLIRSEAITSFPGHRNAEQKIDPYFLGVIIGDGCIVCGVKVTTPDIEIKRMIHRQAEIWDLHIRTEPAGKATTYFLISERGRRSNRLVKELRHLRLYGGRAGDKFVPDIYKYADLPKRMEILAGLLDTDGNYTDKGYDFVSKSKRLADDVAFLCRSAGLMANVKSCVKGYENFRAVYYRVSISGDCTIIPCRVKRKIADKRKQKKSVLRTGFTVEPAGYGKYYGFTVDGDNRYLMSDFTITHNCGKTIVFSSITQEQVSKNHRVLILAHRMELLTQAADKLKATSGLDAALEKGETHSMGSFLPVTVGSVQSLCQEKRLSMFPEDYFQDIIVDEAHHCLSDSYQRVLEHFPEANILGVTATPDRGDKQALGKFFDSLAYEYSMSRAIREKYLAPIKAQLIPLRLDISPAKITNGDFSANDIGYALDPYLYEIAIHMKNYCQGHKTVVFLPLVATSQKFCRILRDFGMRAVEVNGDSTDRTDILTDFENGKYDILCNAMLLTEGWDCPSVDCVVVLRPTKVRSLYQQMVGRGMRLFPGKDHLLLLDFLWMTERHDLCKPSSLIAKDEKIAESIDELLKNNEEVDLIDAEEQAERDVLKEREATLAKQLEEMRSKKKKLVDPIQYALSIAAEDLASYTPTFPWEMGPPSEKQLKFLENRGILPDTVENAGLASLLIDRLKRRQEEGLATPKQIRCLERYGFRQVGTWQFDAASNLISRLAMNHWRVPQGITPSVYTPMIGGI
mgnify:CR=1 FL=1